MKGYVNLTHTNNAKFNNLQEELNKKQSSTPKDNIPLINQQTGKIDGVYIPTSTGNGRRYAGSFSEDGIIVASAYASELQGLNINEIDLIENVGCEFIYTGENIFILNDLEINKNDIVVCNGNITPNWILYDNSDRVVSVNGQTGNVILSSEDVGAITQENVVLLINDAIGNVSALLGDTDDLEV